MSRPAQIEFLSRFAGAYDPAVRLMGFARLWRAVAEAGAPGAGERVLDVCTGTGGAAFELARFGAQVAAVDLAGGMLRRARRKGNGSSGTSFARMDARALAFRDRSFPLVTCSMALHEMSELEREQVLGEISRVASERVVIAEHRVPANAAGAWWFRATRIFEYLESDDFEPFVRRDFRERLSRAGLVAEEPRDVGAYRIWRCGVRA